MLMPTGPEPTDGENDPRSLRIGIIAFLNQTITVGSTWGSFSVLLGANEARLRVNRELSSLAVPALMLSLACLAPVVGILATKYKLRSVSFVGALFSLAGFFVLAVTSSYPLYIAAFGLLLGPGMAVGVVMPSTLVTRWFRVNRGKALGFVNIPIIFTVLPLAATWDLNAHGLRATYLMLAALALVTVIANLFIRDPPASTRPASSLPPGVADDPRHTVAGVLSLSGLLLSPRFWALSIGANASVVGSIILTAHMVPMARSWGMSATAAATLLSVFSLVSIAGSMFFGWLGDQLGGARTLALLILDSAVLWALLLLHPPYVLLLGIMGLIGFHAIGASPVLGLSLAEAFGEKNFSRAFGMANLVALPFTVVAVPIAALIFARTGSYSGVIIAEVAFLLVILPAVVTVRQKPVLAHS